MKIKILIAALAFAWALPSYAHSGAPIPKVVDGRLSGGEKGLLSNVFFKDDQGEVLFIDFDAIGDSIVRINLFSGDKLMMEDDVRDLPDNVIYEINLAILRQGDYTIELVTDQSIKIQKTFVID